MESTGADHSSPSDRIRLTTPNHDGPAWSCSVPSAIRTTTQTSASAALMTVRVGNGGVQPGPLACLEVFAAFGTGP